MPELSVGTAGASANREYVRRAERHHRKLESEIAADASWRQELKSAHPILGRIAAALTPQPTQGPDPHHISTWKTGADGERRVGKRVDLWAQETGGVVLHDRRIPRTTANIDHIALNAEGVWLIDTKEYKGTVSISGGLFSRDELWVSGRLRTHLAASVTTQMGKVAGVLDTASNGTPRPPVSGMLCFIDAEWPLFGGSGTIEGVIVAWPAAMIKLLTPKGRANDSDDLERWARILAAAFPIA